MSTRSVVDRVREAFAAQRPIGVDSNFFEAGFTSTGLAEVLTALQSEGWSLNLVDLYRFPTVRALAAELDRRATAVPAAPRLPWASGSAV
jgi:aryl carrier-like protein